MTARTFLITGASKGIGRALATYLAQAGHTVVGIARQADDASFPGTLIALDLADRQRSAQVLKELSERFAFDGLVNNVGLVRPQALGEIDLEAFDDVCGSICIQRCKPHKHCCRGCAPVVGGGL